jgi:hypothetical protein
MAADPHPGAPDPYEVLGLAPTASDDDVRRAYRRLARAVHPDANPGDAAAAIRFRQLAAAYAVLGDPVRRLRYEHARAGGGSGPRAVRHGPPPSGNTTVRGPGARPSHRPREADPAPSRPERDEWSFLAALARWAAVALVVAVLGIAVTTAVFANDAPPDPPVPSVGRPGGDGFCPTPDGWVSCRLVASRP